ncbi:hypothetical protein COV16_06210 [Candidatus Woesearchaeota archaeon CG10_big_fil_rev_8_21_14_0_10_34_8]|nr:MAG: hypothetical protein COV16_06210 [Candidatus Woesearchaeota archaeon CG10_big_fil_rev_8_21_14_0_10_34_8]
MEIITNCLGTFVIKDSKVIDKKLFKLSQEYNNKKLIIQQQKQLQKEYPKAVITNKYIFPQQRELLQNMRDYNLQNAKQECKNAIKKEHLIIQAQNAINDIEKSINILAKQIQDWYCLYWPELKNDEIHDFINVILTKEKKQKDSMGADLSKEDQKPIKELAQLIQTLFKEKERLELYIENSTQDCCSNLAAVATSNIAAELLACAGSLQRLAYLPSSTIQLLGAEKALFRHLKKHSRCPKHGVIMKHPLISKARRSDHGKIARTLAGAISKASKVDYFKGDNYQGHIMIEELEKKLKKKIKTIK